jgi:hypothetical protein
VTGVVRGSQVPTHRHVPAYVDSLGEEAVDIARIGGIEPDPWQTAYVTDQLGMDTDGMWTAAIGELELSRRNGKTTALHMIVLLFVFLLRARHVVWTTHRGDAALKAFGEMRDIILRTPEFRRELAKPPIATNGKEGFDFLYGGEVRYKTRVDGGGRALEADLLILDEDQALDEDQEASLTALTEANPMAMTIYAGSAGDQRSTVKARLIRQAGLPGLLVYRWAASEDDDPADPATILKTNPGIGRPGPKSLSLDSLLRRQGVMDPVRFGREWLGVGTYPRESGEEWVIPRTAYEASIDPRSAAVSPLVFVPEVGHDRESASISVAGWRSDGRIHVEVVKTGLGTRWVVGELARLARRHPTLAAAADLRGPTGSLLGHLTDAGFDAVAVASDGKVPPARPGKVRLLQLGLADVTRAYGSLYDAWTTAPATILHRGPAVLPQALAVVSTRRVGGATTWSRISTGTVHPLLGVTWAAEALQILSRSPKPPAPPSPRSAATGRGNPTSTADLASIGF